MRFGTRAAIIASFASFAAYNFFFIEPIYTFTIAQPQELFALSDLPCRFGPRPARSPGACATSARA